LSGITKDEIDELFKLANRDSLRGKRNKLYNFISQVAALHPSKAESLYLAVDKILEQYNTVRAKKTVLRQDTRELQENPALIGKSLSLALGSIEQMYNKNGEHVRHTLTEITRLVLTFYNHIPHTAYFPIKGFAATSSEGSMVRSAISGIEQTIIVSRNLTDNNAKQANLERIITWVSNLMHYPEITNEAVLGEHRGYTLTNKTNLSQARDNELNNLVKALAKHLHITLAAYPELNSLFTQEQIVKPFVTRMIIGKEANKVLWPTFANQQAVDTIAAYVSYNLDWLEAQATQNSYKSRAKYSELESSDDDEEPTKPVAKAIIPNELEELRKYKEIMEKGITAGEVKLSFTAREELRRQCPNTYQGKSGGIQKLS
jgi:hypothetical protein